MKWQKVSEKVWRADGQNGSFVITKSRKKYWSQYISANKSFKMPPHTKLSEAQKMCEYCYYWEDVK